MDRKRWIGRMKKMKSILAIAVLSSALALEAARPVVETERIMKENAYEGVWLEIHQRLLYNL